MMKKRTRKKLPATAYISLAETLTWIAFEDAMTQSELRSEVEGQRPPNTDSSEERQRKLHSEEADATPYVPGLGHFEDREQGLKRLSEAWRTLREEVDRRSIKVWGRLTVTYSSPDARLAVREELTGDVLATFSQFDVSKGGIRRQPEGSPDVLWQNHVHSYDREMEALTGDKRAADGYLFVEAERASFFHIFAATCPQHSNVVLPAKAKAEGECKVWLRSAFAADAGMKRGKESFQLDALDHFKGRLSLRGFNRVWDSIAPQSGRSKPGRKS